MFLGWGSGCADAGSGCVDGRSGCADAGDGCADAGSGCADAGEGCLPCPGCSGSKISESLGILRFPCWYRTQRQFIRLRLKNCLGAFGRRCARSSLPRASGIFPQSHPGQGRHPPPAVSGHAFVRCVQPGRNCGSKRDGVRQACFRVLFGRDCSLIWERGERVCMMRD